MNMLPGATRVDVRDYGLGATHFVRNLLLGPSSFQSEDVSGLSLLSGLEPLGVPAPRGAFLVVYTA